MVAYHFYFSFLLRKQTTFILGIQSTKKDDADVVPTQQKSDENVNTSFVWGNGIWK